MRIRKRVFSWKIIGGGILCQETITRGRFLPSINSGGQERAEIVCILSAHLLFILLTLSHLPPILKVK